MQDISILGNPDNWRGGWVKLMRTITETRSYDHANALMLYIHCLMRANISDVIYKGVPLKRGQFLTSIRQMADECDMTYDQARRAFEMLEADSLITKKPANKALGNAPRNMPQNTPKNTPNYMPGYGTVVTVVGYGFADSSSQSDATVNATLPATEDATLPANSIRRKKKEEDMTPYTPQGDDGAFFDRFWNAYPRKENISAARREFDKLNPDEYLLEQMIEAIEAQKDSEQWRRESGRYIPHPSSWIRDRRWEDVTEDTEDDPLLPKDHIFLGW